MDKMSLYDKLKYVRTESGGARNWVGNLRWYVAEEEPNIFSFTCISNLHSSTHEEDLKNIMIKRLFHIDMKDSETKTWTYGADYLSTDCFSVFLPFYEYGGLIFVNQDFEIKFEGECYQKDGCLLVKTGSYYVAFASNDTYQMQEQKVLVSVKRDMWFAVSFHIEEKIAIQSCKKLFQYREQSLEENKVFWNDYLNSCPTVKLNADYEYKHESLNIREYYTPEEIEIRQLWHYYCTLVNVSDVEFNRFPLYMAPDKPAWKGTWGNDGPQCMAALSLTNQKELAKRLIVTYLTNALRTTGEFSWYMHADGVGCYGTKGDVGRYSHSDPYMPHTVAYYIRNTGDASILQEDAGGVTVYEKLQLLFFTRLSKYPLELRKNLCLKKGDASLCFEEEIHNIGAMPCEYTWAHHPNIGYPFLNEKCVIEASFLSEDISVPAQGTMVNEVKTYENVCEGIAVIRNTDTGVGLRFDWDKETFRHCNLWISTGYDCGHHHHGGAYVVCILPSSSKVMGLDKAYETNETYTIEGKAVKKSFFKVSVI